MYYITYIYTHYITYIKLHILYYIYYITYIIIYIYPQCLHILLLSQATISMLNTATRGRATAMAANRVIVRRVVPLEAS